MPVEYEGRRQAPLFFFPLIFAALPAKQPWMKIGRKFDAVIFDLDGTLLDTIEDIADSVNAALLSMGCPRHEIEAYKLMIGEGIRHLAIMALPEPMRGDDSRIDECVRRTAEEYFMRWNVKTKPYEGIPELLDALAGTGLKLAVLSNKPHEFTAMSVRELLPKWRFDSVKGARAGIPVKPDPSSAIEISAELGVAPGRTLFLGDSGVDMRTAVSAGMYPVGVLWGFRGRQELLDGGAREIVSSPGEITL